MEDFVRLLDDLILVGEDLYGIFSEALSREVHEVAKVFKFELDFAQAALFATDFSGERF